MSRYDLRYLPIFQYRNIPIELFSELLSVGALVIYVGEKLTHDKLINTAFSNRLHSILTVLGSIVFQRCSISSTPYGPPDSKLSLFIT